MDLFDTKSSKYDEYFETKQKKVEKKEYLKRNLITIDSTQRNKYLYSNPNQYTIQFHQAFKSVRSVGLVKTRFKHDDSKTIYEKGTLQNNLLKIDWQNGEVSEILLEPGRYFSDDIENLLEDSFTGTDYNIKTLIDEHANLFRAEFFKNETKQYSFIVENLENGILTEHLKVRAQILDSGITIGQVVNTTISDNENLYIDEKLLNGEHIISSYNYQLAQSSFYIPPEYQTNFFNHNQLLELCIPNSQYGVELSDKDFKIERFGDVFYQSKDMKKLYVYYLLNNTTDGSDYRSRIAIFSRGDNDKYEFSADIEVCTHTSAPLRGRLLKIDAPLSSAFSIWIEDDLYHYFYNGTTWSSAGTLTGITGTFGLNKDTTLLAVYDNISDVLKLYNRNGISSDFSSQTGVSQVITGTTTTGITNFCLTVKENKIVWNGNAAIHTANFYKQPDGEYYATLYGTTNIGNANAPFNKSNCLDVYNDTMFYFKDDVMYQTTLDGGQWAEATTVGITGSSILGGSTAFNSLAIHDSGQKMIISFNDSLSGTTSDIGCFLVFKKTVENGWKQDGDFFIFGGGVSSQQGSHFQWNSNCLAIGGVSQNRIWINYGDGKYPVFDNYFGTTTNIKLPISPIIVNGTTSIFRLFGLLGTTYGGTTNVITNYTPIAEDTFTIKCGFQIDKDYYAIVLSGTTKPSAGQYIGISGHISNGITGTSLDSGLYQVEDLSSSDINKLSKIDGNYYYCKMINYGTTNRYCPTYGITDGDLIWLCKETQSSLLPNLNTVSVSSLSTTIDDSTIFENGDKYSLYYLTGITNIIKIKYPCCRTIYEWNPSDVSYIDTTEWMWGYGGTLTSYGTTSNVAIDLSNDKMIYMKITNLEDNATSDTVSVSQVKRPFAKIQFIQDQRDSKVNNNWKSNAFITNPLTFYPELKNNLDKLKIEFRDKSGELYNFNGVDHFLTFEIIEVLDGADSTGIGSNRDVESMMQQPFKYTT